MLGPNDHEVGRTPSYPGVYIDELPGAVHLISGVSTSVTYTSWPRQHRPGRYLQWRRAGWASAR